MKHLTLFQTQAEFDAATLELPNVSFIEDSNKISYHKSSLAYEFVDLGLPSGTKWCSCNLGASDVYDVGLYYLNGGELGYKVEVEWVKPPYVSGSFKIVSSEPGGFDFSTYNILEFKDAANIIHTDMSIPSTDDIEELVNNGTFLVNDTYTTYTSNINGNTIIFPNNYVCMDGGILHEVQTLNVFCRIDFAFHGLNACMVYDSECMGAWITLFVDVPIKAGMPIRPVLKN